jgi:hypothetical protein
MAWVSGLNAHPSISLIGCCGIVLFGSPSGAPARALPPVPARASAAAPQEAAPRPTKGQDSVANLLSSFVERFGGKVTDRKGRILTISHSVAEQTVAFKVVADAPRNRVGFYAYGFGNLKTAVDREGLLRYLIHANSSLEHGAFFVDEAEDIGLKRFMLYSAKPQYDDFSEASTGFAATIASHFEPIQVYFQPKAG